MFGLGKIKEKMSGSVARLNGNTDLLEGICAACVMVGAADGDFSDAEAGVALERLMNHDTLSVAFTGTQIEQAFDKQAKRAKSGMSGRLGLRREIEEAAAKATADDKELLFVIAIDVAYADGDCGEKEKTALNTIGQIVKLELSRYTE